MAHPLLAVSDGQEAIDYLAGHGHFRNRQKYPLPCLLLLDLKLPVKNGFDVLKWIRESPETRSLPVVIISGSNQQADYRAAMEWGVTDYVVKSSAPSHLLETLRRKKKAWLR